MPGPPLSSHQAGVSQQRRRAGRHPAGRGAAGREGAEHGPGPRVRPWPPVCCCLVPTGNRDPLLAELKAGAESGWDFSSRWLLGGPNPSSLSSIRTSKLVPVDLNAFLCQVEGLMSNFYSTGCACPQGRKEECWLSSGPCLSLGSQLQGGL